MTCLEARLLKLASAWMRFAYLAGDAESDLYDQYIAPETTPTNNHPLCARNPDLVAAIDDLVAARRVLDSDEYGDFAGGTIQLHLEHAVQELRSVLQA